MNEEAKRTAAALRHCFLYELGCKNCPSTDECDWHNETMPLKAADLIESLSAQLDRVTMERDAAVNSMRGKCTECIHDYPGITHLDGTVCNDCMFNGTAYAPHTDNWQWRGVKKEVEG